MRHKTALETSQSLLNSPSSLCQSKPSTSFLWGNQLPLEGPKCPSLGLWPQVLETIAQSRGGWHMPVLTMPNCLLGHTQPSL